MRTRLLVLLAGGIVAVGMAASVASGKPSTTAAAYSAKLNIAQEVPKEHGAPANAGGTFTATLTGKTLKWKLTFAHLTGPATAAHIHMAAMGKPGGVIVPLCGPCKASSSGSAKVTAATIAALNDGQAYVNVHTTKNPNGEIRGQIGM